MNFSEQNFAGMGERIETSPQSKKVSQNDWNLSPISSQIYGPEKAEQIRLMALIQN